jgi:hypothetical protein
MENQVLSISQYLLIKFAGATSVSEIDTAFDTTACDTFIDTAFDTVCDTEKDTGTDTETDTGSDTYYPKTVLSTAVTRYILTQPDTHTESITDLNTESDTVTGYYVRYGDEYYWVQPIVVLPC